MSPYFLQGSVPFFCWYMPRNGSEMGSDAGEAGQVVWPASILKVVHDANKYFFAVICHADHKSRCPNLPCAIQQMIAGLAKGAVVARCIVTFPPVRA